MLDGRTEERLRARLYASIAAFAKANGVVVRVLESRTLVSHWADGKTTEIKLTSNLPHA